MDFRTHYVNKYVKVKARSNRKTEMESLQWECIVNIVKVKSYIAYFEVVEFESQH